MTPDPAETLKLLPELTPVLRFVHISGACLAFVLYNMATLLTLQHVFVAREQKHRGGISRKRRKGSCVTVTG